MTSANASLEKIRIIDESDNWISIPERVRVVRGPEKRVNAGKALAPLIQGVIERRKTHYGTVAATTATTAPPPQVKAKAFDKIRVKGGEIPDRRSGFLNRQMSSSGVNTPLLSRSPTNPSMMIANVNGGEREPSERDTLLSRTSTVDEAGAVVE
jgi:metal transporter CNNM